MGLLLLALLVIVALAIYFTPFIVASDRRLKNAGSIFILNLFFGWTIVGWVIALCWSCAGTAAQKPIDWKAGKRQSSEKAPSPLKGKTGTPPIKKPPIFVVSAILATVIIVGIISGTSAKQDQNSPAPTAPAPENANVAQPEHSAEEAAPKPTEEPINPWLYQTTTDKITQKEVWSAVTKSSNMLTLDFPYNEPQKASLLLLRHPQYGKDAMIYVNHGQILCESFDKCSVMVRFDNQPAERYPAFPPDDHASNTIFVQNTDKFFRKIVKAKKVYVQVPFYQNGNQLLEFNVEGLKLDK